MENNGLKLIAAGFGVLLIGIPLAMILDIELVFLPEEVLWPGEAFIFGAAVALISAGFLLLWDEG